MTVVQFQFLQPTRETPLTSTRERLAEVARQHPEGVTVRALQAALPDIHPQTVNSTQSAMRKKGWFVDSGKRERTSEGGRPAIVFLFRETPEPAEPKTKSKKNAPAASADKCAAIAKTKAKLTALLDGESAHFIAKTVLDIMEARKVSYQFVADQSFNRAKERGLVTNISFNTPLPDFVPKRRKK